VTTVVANTANDGVHSWTVTGPATTQAVLHIFSVSTPTVRDTSDAAFTLGGGRVTVSLPTGGEQWPIRSIQPIRWSATGITENVKIELSRNGGQTWTTILGSTVNDGTENWTVTGPTTTQARVRITSLNEPAAVDASNGNFTIQ
jgi:hypothetical protein